MASRIIFLLLFAVTLHAEAPRVTELNIAGARFGGVKAQLACGDANSAVLAHGAIG